MHKKGSKLYGAVSNSARKRDSTRPGIPFPAPSIKQNNFLPYIGLFLILGAGYLVFTIFQDYAWPAFSALLLYVGFYEMHKQLLLYTARYNIFKGGNGNALKGWAAAISTLLACALIIVPSIFIVKQLIGEIYWLIEQIHHFFADEQSLTKLENLPWLGEFVSRKPFFWVDIFNFSAKLTKDFGSYLDPGEIGNWLQGLFRFVRGGVGLTLSFVYNLLLMLILLYFLFRDGPSFYRFLRKALPFPLSVTDYFTASMQRTTMDVLRGNIFVSLLQGSALGLALLVCGFESIFTYGAIAAIFAIVPIIGTAVIWLPSALYLATVEARYGAALLLAIYGLSVYLALENFLKPKLLDSKLGIHPLFLFFSILGGLAEFGISGVILGPLFLVLFKTIWSIYHVWEPKD